MADLVALGDWRCIAAGLGAADAGDTIFVNHDPANPPTTDAEGLKQELEAQHSAYPDMNVGSDDLITQGDQTVTFGPFTP